MVTICSRLDAVPRRPRWWTLLVVFLPLVFCAISVAWWRSYRAGDVIFAPCPVSRTVIASKSGRLQLVFFRQQIVRLPPHADLLLTPRWGHESWPVHPAWAYRFDPDDYLIAQVPKRLAFVGFNLRYGRDTLGIFSWCVIVMPYWSILLVAAGAIGWWLRATFKSMGHLSDRGRFEIKPIFDRRK